MRGLERRGSCHAATGAPIERQDVDVIELAPYPRAIERDGERARWVDPSVVLTVGTGRRRSVRRIGLAQRATGKTLHRHSASTISNGPRGVKRG